MKINKEEQARREGMSYALRIAKERGIEGLEEELKFRNCTDIPIGYDRKACDEAILRIKNQTCDTMMALWTETIHDELGLGQKRCQRLIDRFESKAECLAGGYVTWKDIVANIKKELKFELKLRLFDQNVRC